MIAGREVLRYPLWVANGPRDWFGRLVVSLSYLPLRVPGESFSVVRGYPRRTAPDRRSKILSTTWGSDPPSVFAGAAPLSACQPLQPHRRQRSGLRDVNRTTDRSQKRILEKWTCESMHCGHSRFGNGSPAMR